MTYAGGIFDPSPLANPFNVMSKRVVEGKGITHMKDSKNLKCPDSSMPEYGTEEWNLLFDKQRSLQVPNQDIPLGDLLHGGGFLQRNPNLFLCQDGTLLDILSGKTLQLPNDPESKYWGNPNKTLEFNSVVDDSAGHMIDNFILNVDSYFGRNQLQANNLDAIDDLKSLEYWKHANEEAEKMKSLMTTLQLSEIEEFERHFPKSKFIDESKKSNQKQGK